MARERKTDLLVDHVRVLRVAHGGLLVVLAVLVTTRTSITHRLGFSIGATSKAKFISN